MAILSQLANNELYGSPASGEHTCSILLDSEGLYLSISRSRCVALCSSNRRSYNCNRKRWQSRVGHSCWRRSRGCRAPNTIRKALAWRKYWPSTYELDSSTLNPVSLGCKNFVDENMPGTDRHHHCAVQPVAPPAPRASFPGHESVANTSALSFAARPAGPTRAT